MDDCRDSWDRGGDRRGDKCVEKEGKLRAMETARVGESNKIQYEPEICPGWADRAGRGSASAAVPGRRCEKTAESSVAV
jgi:hypothetical protein